MVLACAILVYCEVEPNCANDCEDQMWGRLMVGIRCQSVDPEIFVISPDGEKMNAADLGPFIWTGMDEQGLLTFDYFAAPREDYVILGVTIPGGDTVFERIPLAKHNYCGRNIAYVELSCEEQGVRFSDVRYISPCRGKK